MEDGDTIEVRPPLKGSLSQPAFALRDNSSRGLKVQKQATSNAYERLQLCVPAAFAGADTCNWRLVLRALSKMETSLKSAHAAQRLALSCKPAERLQASCIQTQSMAALQKPRCSNAERSFPGSAVLHHRMALPLAYGGLLQLSQKTIDLAELQPMQRSCQQQHSKSLEH